MCGIVGIVDLNGVNPREIHSMNSILNHRGPDDEGYLLADREGFCTFYKGKDTIIEKNELDIRACHFDKKKIIAIGHRRLSIIDLSPGGHQPMQFLNLVISFNGEIYNYIEIRESLVSIGYSFTTNTDTEVILKAYHHWGEKCVSMFVGMWAMVILDFEKNRIFCSRDRFGIKPLYYYKTDQCFAFASEIKALFCYNNVIKKVDEENLFAYLYRGNIDNLTTTLFKDISEFPSGSNAIFGLENMDLKISRYYDVGQIKSEDKVTSIEEAGAHYHELLQNSLKIHLRSDVPVGSCLSGGIDSSSITAMSAQINKGIDFNTFTAAYYDKNVDESNYVSLIIKMYENVRPYYIYPDSRTFWIDIEKLVWHQDLPINSSSVFAQWEVMKTASASGMKVLLDGQGVDEVLGGYKYFMGVYAYELLRSLRMLKLVHELYLMKVNRSVNSIQELGRTVLSNSFPGLENFVRRRYTYASDLLSNDFRDEHLHDFAPNFSLNDLYKASVYSIKHVLPELLRYEDRNSMAFSIKSRVPFLDHRIVDFSMSLPNDFKIYKGWSKYVLRKAVENSIPQQIAWRKDKKGFDTPQAQWKNKSKIHIRNFLDSIVVPPYFENARLRKYLLNEEIDTRSQSEFWRIISILCWFKINESK